MRRRLTRLAPALVTLTLLALLLRQVAPGRLVALLAGASPLWLAAGTGIYVAVNVLRAVRFRLLLPASAASVAGLLPLSLAVSLLNNTLPMRTGEVGFVVLARSALGVPAAEGAAALAVARLFDYMAVAALFVPLVGLSLGRLPPTTDWPAPGMPTPLLVGGIALFVLAGAVVALSLAGLGGRAVALLAWLLERLGLHERPLAERLVAFGERTVAALAVLRTRRTYGAAFGLSLAIWVLLFAWLYAFVRAVGEPGAPGLFVVGATFSVLSKSLPLPTMGGIGVAETGWALGFTLVGWSADRAIATGLAVSVLTLAMSAALGLPSLAWLRRTGAAAPGAGDAGGGVAG